MKDYMNMKTNILSLLAFAGLLTFASCANDDTTNNDKEPGTEGLTGFVVEEDNATRTTAEYDGSGLKFFWTANDRLWVNNGTLTQDASNNISSVLVNNPANASAVQRAAKARFWFSGTFTGTSYPVRYTGKGNADGDKVTIKAAQAQTIPNDASHIGEDGDCGIATATKPAGDTQYHFTLDHEASYLTFMPYNAQGKLIGVLQKIKVSADQAICGQFDFNDAGIDTGTRPAASPTTQNIELTVSGFSIPAAATKETNAATMVIAPGVYTHFTVEYTLYDPITNVGTTITKQYPGTVTCTKGRNKKVSQDLNITVYHGNEYYSWDAQQQYWAGHEWDKSDYVAGQDQPTVNNSTVASAYAQDNTDPRWWREDTSLPAPAANHSCQNCPNVNECIWYTMQGDPHWDEQTLWATMGHLYKAGMWFKKKDNISGFTASNYNGTDYRTTSGFFFANNSTPGKPSNLNDYFYLPALGTYYNGFLSGVGSEGFYWTSSPTGYVHSANCLFFDSSNGASVCDNGREAAFRLWTVQ